MKLSDLPTRLQSKIRVEGACWIWTAASSGSGYGRVWSPTDRRIVQAHRYVYTLLVGEVPEHLDLDHFKCERRLCVYPKHVRPATRRENVLRGQTLAAQNRARTRCPGGHRYSGRNLVTRSRGTRECRECVSAKNRKQYLRRKALTS